MRFFCLGVGARCTPSACASRIEHEVAWPITLIGRKMLDEGAWPDTSRQHNVCALHKRGKNSDARDDRGVHLTAQVSKVIERVFSFFLQGFCNNHGLWGSRRFAYTWGT